MNRTPLEIVLIDDEELTKIRLERTLRKVEWTVRYFSDATEAKGYLIDHAPALVLIDQQMPRIDGDQLLMQLHALPHLARTPLAICSSVAPPAKIVSRIEELGGIVIDKDTLAHWDELRVYLDHPDLDPA